MTDKRKAAPQEIEHRKLLKSMGIKPLPGPPRHRESLPGQAELFDAEDGSNEVASPEDAQ